MNEEHQPELERILSVVGFDRVMDAVVDVLDHLDNRG